MTHARKCWSLAGVLIALQVGGMVTAVNCTHIGPRQPSPQSYAERNLVELLNTALERGDKVKKHFRGTVGPDTYFEGPDWIPHDQLTIGGDWVKKGEVWDFKRYRYEIVRP